MFWNKLKLGIAALLVLGTGAAVVGYQVSTRPGDRVRNQETTELRPLVGGAMADPMPAEALAPVPSQNPEFAGPIASWPILVDKDPKTKAILAALEKPLAIKFGTDTPLQDVTKYIRDSTIDKAAGLPSGIPIYVDPQGLQDADKTMQSTIVCDLEGVPLKITLRLILKQLGLCYSVSDGILVITANNPDDRPSPFDRLLEMDKAGELSKEQYKELMEVLKLRIELLKLREQVGKLEFESGYNDQ